jgi:hypothetical protein
MVLHLAVFRWRPGVTDDDVEALAEDLLAFRQQLGPLLVGYHFGPDLGLRPGNGDYAVAALVGSAGDIALYLDHPAHKDLFARRLGAMTEARLAVQIDVGQASVI